MCRALSLTELWTLQGGVEGGRVRLPQGHSRGDPVPVQKKKVCVLLYVLHAWRSSPWWVVFMFRHVSLSWQTDREPWTSEAGDGELVQECFWWSCRPSHSKTSLRRGLGWHQWMGRISRCRYWDIHGYKWDFLVIMGCLCTRCVISLWWLTVQGAWRTRIWNPTVSPRLWR